MAITQCQIRMTEPKSRASSSSFGVPSGGRASHAPVTHFGGAGRSANEWRCGSLLGEWQS